MTAITTSADRWTIDEIARRAGMSARTIRAHQARRLLARPRRIGRTAYYGPGHLRRLEAIKALQRQGFNLTAIDALLADPDTARLNALLRRLRTEQPALLHALGRHGVIEGADRQTPHCVRSQALRSALDLPGAGVAPVAALRLLAETLDALDRLTGDLVRSAPVRWPAADLAAMLVEAFRVTVERNLEAGAQAWATSEAKPVRERTSSSR